MTRRIDVSEKVYEHLIGLDIEHKLVSDIEEFKETQNSPTINFQPDLSDYIFVPGYITGIEKRSDSLVCKYRLEMSQEVEQAGKILNLSLDNTAKEKNGRDYIGNINHNQAVTLNLLLGGRTQDVRLATDFLRLIYSGEAVDGNGESINSSELKEIFNEITKKREPWRAEWFEDSFVDNKGKLYLKKHYVLEDEKLTPIYSHELESLLMEDKIPGIDLESWIENPTSQGFPKKNAKPGNLRYWHPRNNSVARFDANPDLAGFDCSRYSLDSNSRLGVRHVREAHAKK